MLVSISVDSCKIDYQKYDTILSLISNCTAITLYDLQKKIPTGIFLRASLACYSPKIKLVHPYYISPIEIGLL